MNKGYQYQISKRAILRGGGQYLERPIFRNFEISNIKITKVELFDFSIFLFIFHFHLFKNYSNTQNAYMIVLQIFKI